MTRRFCDACGTEIHGFGRLTFDYLCHIGQRDVSRAFVDPEGNRCSGKPVSQDVCQRCYNEIYEAAFRCFQSIREA